jgi:hypothetical protein
MYVPSTGSTADIGPRAVIWHDPGPRNTDGARAADHLRLSWVAWPSVVWGWRLLCLRVAGQRRSATTHKAKSPQTIGEEELSTISGWCLPFRVGLLGCGHGLEHTFDPATGAAATSAAAGAAVEGPVLPDDLAGLAAAVDELAAQDRDGLSDAVRAARVLELRRLLDRQEGHWLQELAAVDARGAAGADPDQPACSTASWLRTRRA